MAQAQYWIEIHNEYLGKYRRVTGRTRREVELKAAEQLQRWSEQEARARERQAVADAKERARLATEEAQALIEEYRSILAATLDVDDRLDWDSLKDHSKYPPPPELDTFLRDVPRPRPLLEKLRLVSRTKREAAEAEARRAYEEALAEHERGVAAHAARQEAQNAEVDAFRTSYEAGEPESVERYVSLVLASSAFPAGLERETAVAYQQADKSLIVDVELPTPEDLPTVVEHRYIASRRVVEEKHMKAKERDALYEDVVLQIMLRTIHEVFEGEYAGHVDLVVVNGMVNGVDPGTGKDFRACIASCQTTREQFTEYDLARVEPKACFRSLKGLSAAKLATVTPVAPIRVMDREDPRFIEAEGVLDGLEADTNLMTMDWQEFEVLVRDLFEKMFASKGVEVKVTRSSRDEGVDAVVFDPDPLTGGKTIIQAKRYRRAVPVAAVRELYGTVVNEGAGKGILVTTSHFGASAQEFAKDKPLTLIDGANLLHLMQNHGHRVRIDLTEVREDLLSDVPSSE